MLLLKNCSIVRETGVVKTDILIDKGKIQKIAPGLKGEPVIDAKGMLVLPGLIDSHVHCREPGLEYKEDFNTATMAAAAGGVTTILDMPNNQPPVLTAADLENKRNVAKGKCIVNYGFYFGCSANTVSEIPKVKNIAAVKVYMDQTTGHLMITDTDVLEEVFETAPFIAAHAESTSLEIAIDLAETYNKRLYICHVATEREMEVIRTRKTDRIFAEVTPHHLFLTEDDAQRLKGLGLMKPGLQSKQAQQALWVGIKEGLVDTIATDHAPHTWKEKNSHNPPMGVPGLETILPLLVTAAEEGKLSYQDIMRLCCENPARIFGIPNKGKLEVGFDADLVVLDPKAERTVDPDALYTKCHWSPFKNMKLKGWPRITICNGEVVFREGVFGKPVGKEVVFKRIM